MFNMITTTGCWELLKMKKRGEKLPKSWKEDIIKCRETKLRAIKLGLNPQYNKLRLMEIENIMRELGLDERR